MRAGVTPTPFEFPALADVEDLGDPRWVGWGKAKERPTPGAQWVAMVVTATDASLARLEEVPGAPGGSGFSSGGRPIRLRKRPAPPPARLRRAGGRVASEIFPWDACASGLSETRGSRSLPGPSPAAHFWKVGCALGPASLPLPSLPWI